MYGYIFVRYNNHFPIEWHFATFACVFSDFNAYNISWNSENVSDSSFDWAQIISNYSFNNGNAHL